MRDAKTRPAEAALGAFLGYGRRRGHAEGTRIQYGRYLRLFAKWAGSRPLDSITAQEIELEYLGTWYEDFERQHGKAPSGSTMRNHVQALRSFFNFCERFDVLTVANPMVKIDSPKVRRKMKPWLRPEEDEAMLAAPQTPREQIVIWFLRFAGLRWGECMALTQRDVDLATGLISVPDSKTDNGIRQVPIFPDVRPAIVRWFDYLDSKGLRDQSLPFFTTRHGNPMSEQQAIVITKRVAKRAGIWPVCPHALRRTFGSSLLNEGKRLEVVSKLLGHGSTTVTEQSYAELLNSTIVREALAVS